MTYLLDTNAISDLMRASPRIENWMADWTLRIGSSYARLCEVKHSSGFPGSRRAGGGRSWNRPGISSWRPFGANRSRKKQVIFTLSPNSLVVSAGSHWMRTISGWPPRRR